MSFVSHLEAAIDGTVLPAGVVQTTHAGRPIWVRYDLNAVRGACRREDLVQRPSTMWRYRELLPAGEGDGDLVSLGETMTPLLAAPALARHLGMRRLLIKDESRLPTGSFKARGMAMAVTMARRLGVRRVAAPTAGNAGGALAAYAARAGLECYIFMPADTPAVNRGEAALHGARSFLVNGLIHDCARLVREGQEHMAWFDMSTLREPYRIEGKKTMGLELAEQMGWRLPDVILYPTGGGTGLIGMWKVFGELREIGWLERPALSRLYACQSSGCPPIVRAFEAGERFAPDVADPHTVASGVRVPKALGDFMILDAVRASGGKALEAPEDRVLEWMQVSSALEGISICPETAVCIGALAGALESGEIAPEDTVVVFNTAGAQKYVEAMERDLETIDCTRPVDWERLEVSPQRHRGHREEQAREKTSGQMKMD